MTETVGLFLAVQQVPDTPKGGPDQSLNQIALFNLTVGECTPMQAVKQPVKSFDHQEVLKMLLFSDELWLIISVAPLILSQAFKVRVLYIYNIYIYIYIYIYYIYIY